MKPLSEIMNDVNLLSKFWDKSDETEKQLIRDIRLSLEEWQKEIAVRDRALEIMYIPCHECPASSPECLISCKDAAFRFAREEMKENE